MFQFKSAKPLTHLKENVTTCLPEEQFMMEAVVKETVKTRRIVVLIYPLALKKGQSVTEHYSGERFKIPL